MIGIIMIPSTVHAKGYTVLDAIGDMKMSRLVLHEEMLGKLHKECARLLRDAGRALGIARVCFSTISGFVWDKSEYKPTSIEVLAHQLEQKVGCLSQSLANTKSLLDEGRMLMEDRTGQESILMGTDVPSKAEEYEFIDCFYCAVGRKVEREFLALRLAALLLKRDGRTALYKIYCLKRDSEGVFELLSQRYICRRFQSSSADNASHVRRSMAEAEKKLRELFDCIVNTELHIGLLRAYAESLHRFGLPPEFRYKIAKDVTKELKELGANNRLLPRTMVDELPLICILELER